MTALLDRAVVEPPPAPRRAARRLCPAFIVEHDAAGRRAGALRAICIDVDISGFTVATETLSGQGPEGAELLAQIVGAVFEPLTSSVYEFGGFIAHFTGDGFVAMFPVDAGAGQDAAAASALAAAWQMRQAIRSRHTYRTPFGALAFNARIGMAGGAVGWRIFADATGARRAYCFTGAPLVDAARVRALAGPGELFAEPSLLSALPRGAAVHARARGAAREIVDADGLPEPHDAGPTHAGPTHAGPHDAGPQVAGPAHPVADPFSAEALAHAAAVGEFRQSVNLFVELDDADPALDAFVAALFEAQDRYGGYLQGVTISDKGCSALMFWGAPVATENDLGRALECAADLLGRGGMRLRAGVAHGVSHAGFIGGAAHACYSCQSSAVNLAARLMAAAEWGELLMDRATRDHALERFEVAPRGALRLKGFAEEHAVFALGARRRDIARVAPAGALVDRDEALATLHAAVCAVLSGKRPGVAVVVGEAGTGKSSLMRALVARLSPDVAGKSAPRWLRVEADEVRAQSLGPFRRVLREAMGVEASHDEAAQRGLRRARFDAALDALRAGTADPEVAAELDLTRPFLAALADLDEPGPILGRLGREARVRNAIRALVAFLRALAAAGPLALLVDNVHACDPDTRALLRALSAHPDPALAIVAASRREDDGAFPELPFDPASVHATVALGALSGEGVRVVAERALGGAVSERIVDVLLQRTGGNPFYLEQMLLTLGARGAFITRGRGAGARVELAEDAQEGIPAGVNGIIVARIDRLPSGLKTVVQVAAALGRDVDVPLLRAILSDEARLDEQIATGLAQQIWERAGPDRLRFRHALLCDVAYDMQLMGVRRALHRRAAEALERMDGPQDLERLGALAFHCKRAGLDAAARRYLRMAGDAAAALFEVDSAVRYYRRLLEYPLDAAEEAAVCARLGELLGITGDWVEAETVLDRGLTCLVGAAGARRAVEMLIAMGDVLRKSNDHARARERLGLALATARRSGDAHLVGKATVVLAGSYKYAGDYARALALYERALAVGERIGDERLKGVSLAGVASAHGLMGDCRMAIGFNRRAIPLLEALGERQELIYPLINLGIDLFTVGDYDEAPTMFQRCLRESAAIGDREGVWFAYHFLGRVRHETGDPAEAVACYEKAMRERLALGGDGIPYDTLPHMAAARLALGDHAAALAAVLAHLDALEHGEPDREHGLTHLMAARLLACGGDEARAALAGRQGGADPEAWLRAAERAARAGGAMGLMARIHTLTECARLRLARDGAAGRESAERLLAAAWTLAGRDGLAGDRRFVERVARECGVEVARLATTPPLFSPFGDEAAATP